jgi:hypothetical protein
MNFKTFRETDYRSWTIQHTWHTSDERPGPDGFDRVAIRGEERVEQGADSWTAFLTRLDEIDGLRAREIQLGQMALSSQQGKEPGRDKGKASSRGRKAARAHCPSQPMLFSE